MVRGFLAGSLALIALYVLVQKGAAEKAGQASGVVQSGIRRFLSPGVAGVGNHRTSTSSSSSPSGSAGTPVATSTSGQFYTV